MKPEYLSASRITQYLMCPLKYHLQYEEQVPWDFTPSNLVLGSAVHAALEAYFRTWGSDGIELPLEELSTLFCDYWDRETEGKQLEPKVDAKQLKQVGLGLLSAFSKTVEPCSVRAVEEKFRVPLVNPETGEYLIDLVGIFDLIETDDTGSPTIIDHKTCAKRPSDRDLDQHLQLTAYGYATRILQELTGDSILLRINCLVKNKKPVFEHRYTVRTPDHDQRFFRLASDILHALEQDAFPPNPGWVCGSCQIKSHCYWGRK